MEPDISKLILLIKKKKPSALEKIMNLYMNSVYGIAKSIIGTIGSEEDIEECVQDVFIDVWDNIDKYDAERGAFKTWIFILCKYKALNKKKSIEPTLQTVAINETHFSSDSLEKSLLSKEAKSEIIDAIKSLGKIDREVFVRRFLLEESINEICEFMNLSRQAVDNRLWRGKKLIRAILNSKERGHFYG
ncbi:RNA polymerase sigma-70 factor (ECF subfamily) [Natranaerovirga pectinivora]|uniref:RNA polymerase sigma-70 factor (ECF subfamily) n=1 Tax=Natranaerovirga pectinivora TaxID=682400 RepID=A0A4R3MSG6_9FIRM|nr:sigma-70 family RNA polymerase sigma factor [Natranaerovirga pectinivora]TCT17178.1 RNA polymerase sigma-70 factor (ECF subfamily) [Natranaerovirga pectinivora]